MKIVCGNTFLSLGYIRGGGTGPADSAAAGPIIYSENTRTKNYHKNIF